jgi:hypothetical protein
MHAYTCLWAPLGRVDVAVAPRLAAPGAPSGPFSPGRSSHSQVGGSATAATIRQARGEMAACVLSQRQLVTTELATAPPPPAPSPLLVVISLVLRTYTALTRVCIVSIAILLSVAYYYSI